MTTQKKVGVREGALTIDGLTLALLFFYRGVKIAPCQPKSKSFVQGFGPYLNHIETDMELQSWLLERGSNYALLTGTGGLVVVDFDNVELFNQWYEQAGNLANSFTVKTRRGYHVYYFSQDIRSWKGAGFEVMGLHKAVMGPMSSHPAGGIYEPLCKPVIREVETISDFPLLSETRPALAEPPKVRPEHLGGGVVQKIKLEWAILGLITSSPMLSERVKLKSTDKKQGRWYAGFCPFHEDRHKPSLWVDTERNLFGCRACDARGDVINFVAMLEGWTVQEAIQNMARGQL